MGYEELCNCTWIENISYISWWSLIAIGVFTIGLIAPSLYTEMVHTVSVFTHLVISMHGFPEEKIPLKICALG